MPYDGDVWPAYVPVAQRKKLAGKEIDALRKKGRDITPIAITGRAIASTYWGKSWCHHLESYSDYANRLPRGRTYVRNGSVVHLAIVRGRIDALVRGSEMYTVTITVAHLDPRRWSAVVEGCAGKIDSLVELLQGKLSKAVMEIVAHRDRGLFPSVDEIELGCSCPDYAEMCKHVAAVLYGVGARLDHEPALLFALRGVDPSALFATSVAAKVTRATKGAGRAKERTLANDALGSVFGIDMEVEGDVATGDEEAAPVKKSGRATSTKAKRSVAKKNASVAASSTKVAAASAKGNAAKRAGTRA